MKQPVLRGQWQKLTTKKLNELVTFYIDWWFHKQYLTDCRVYDMIHSGRFTKEQLIDEMSAIFFKSLSTVLADLNRKSNEEIEVTWTRTYDQISWSEIVYELCDKINKCRKKRDIIQPLRNIWLNFNSKTPYYSMNLLVRTKLIVDYVTLKYRYSPEFIEDCKNYRYDPTPITRSDGVQFIPHNLKGFIQLVTREHNSRSLELEREIWHPTQTNCEGRSWDIELGRRYY